MTTFLARAACAAAIALPVFAQTAPPLRGFTPTQYASQQALEQNFRALPDPVRARQYLEKMAAEPHHAGSPASKAVAEYAAGLFRSWGLQVQIEEFESLLPYPTSRRLEILSPTPHAARLAEPPLAADPDSSDLNQLPTYNAYSASGDVTGDLVYVNYGIPADYEELKKLGIDVKGKIVIARYGRSWRGTKAKTAQEHGAIGCIIYSDPRDDGYFQGDAFPKGPWRPAESAQRGSVMDMPLYVGDPLSPGWASEKGARRLDRSEAVTLMKIPVLPISYADAQPFLAALAGPVAPPEWRGGLPLTYHIGPGPAKVRLAVDFDWSSRPLYNVIATLPGAEFPDEWVIYGNHHDAWVNGASDPVSGAAALLETARSLAVFSQSGWKPKRTIKFALWDGEEFGLLGSTEWVEKHRDELQRKTVFYLNSDTNSNGKFGVGGSATLEAFFAQVVRDTVGPADRPASTELGPLGSGSDYVAFVHHSGIASLNMGFGAPGSGGTYHSIYDSPAWYIAFMDKDFEGSRKLSRVTGTALLRASEAPILPFEFSAVERNVRKWIAEAAKKTDVSAVITELDKLAPAAAAYEKALAAQPQLAPDRLRRLNAILLTAEQALTRPGGLPQRPWYKHQLSAPGLYTGYGSVTLPAVNESLQLGRTAEAEAGVTALVSTLAAFRGVAERATSALQ
ncbi:MAG: M28 family peptidase [Bryobacterales bacterium]|nr:M28 family peptidase [Bryobacterales bacterium]